MAACAPADDAEPIVDPDETVRLVEALLFAAVEPLDVATLRARLPEEHDVEAAIERLRAHYAGRGVNLVKLGARYAFRTAPDLSWLLSGAAREPRKLSRAAMETLAIIAYHQPVTRAEIEEIRGVSISRGTLDVLLDTGWIRLRGRRRTPGRPVTYGTTPAFLEHFNFEAITDLPGLDELKGAGLLDGRLPPGFSVPQPHDDSALTADEDPLDPADLSLGFPAPEDGDGA